MKGCGKMSKVNIATIILLFILLVIILAFFAYEHGRTAGKLQRMREEMEKENNGHLYNELDNKFSSELIGDGNGSISLSCSRP